MIPGVLDQLSIVAEVIPPEGEEEVVFLSGFEGIDGSTGPMVDELTFEHVMTFNGNVELDTAQQKFGASSLESVISIGTDDYISVPNHTCFHFGDGDFTIEGFARSASLTGPHNFVALGTSPDLSFRALLTELFSNDVLQFTHSVDGTTIVNTTSSTISVSVNTWYHWAFVRNNLGPGDDTLYFFINGVQFGDGSLNQDVLFPSTDDFIINGRGDGFEGHRGHLDEVRVLNYAAYTANFTPPAAPFDRPPSGVLSGTTSLAFTAAATLAGSAALAGASTLTFTPSADLDATAEGELSGSANLMFTPAADLAITQLWTPTELGADVILWWDFSDQGNLTLSGSSITAVDDLSPANESSIISGTTNQQPTSSTVSDWANLYGAVFSSADGGDDQIGAAAGVAQPYCAAMIFRTGASVAELEQLWGTNGTTQVSLKWSGISNNPHCFAGSAVQRWAANLSSSTNYIDITTLNGASSVTRINGTAGSSFSPGTTSEAGSNIGIGKFNGSYGASKSTYGEVVLVDRTLTTQEAEKLEGYFAHKFSRTADLPGGHPYKTVPPTT